MQDDLSMQDTEDTAPLSKEHPHSGPAQQQLYMPFALFVHLYAPCILSRSTLQEFHLITYGTHHYTPLPANHLLLALCFTTVGRSVEKNASLGLREQNSFQGLLENERDSACPFLLRPTPRRVSACLLGSDIGYNKQSPAHETPLIVPSQQ